MKENIENKIYCNFSNDEIEIEILKELIHKHIAENLINYSEIFENSDGNNNKIETDAEENRKNSNESIQLLNNEEAIKSKSCIILERLKRIKKRATINSDQETIEDIDWILENFVDNDINEPEFKKKLIMDDVNQTDLENHYLKEYSQQGTSEKRKTDLKLIKIKSLNNTQNNFLNLNGT